jgi:hypothetical protein
VRVRYDPSPGEISVVDTSEMKLWPVAYKN